MIAWSGASAQTAAAATQTRSFATGRNGANLHTVQFEDETG
jgi:hypothetical protein